MKNVTYAAFTIAILMSSPALGLEVECDTPISSGAEEIGLQHDDNIMVDDALIRRRKATREADLARAREQLESRRSRNEAASTATLGPAERR